MQNAGSTLLTWLQRQQNPHETSNWMRAYKKNERNTSVQPMHHAHAHLHLCALGVDDRFTIARSWLRHWKQNAGILNHSRQVVPSSTHNVTFYPDQHIHCFTIEPQVSRCTVSRATRFLVKENCGVGLCYIFISTLATDTHRKRGQLLALTHITWKTGCSCVNTLETSSVVGTFFFLNP